jgi:hypothetical protein
MGRKQKLDDYVEWVRNMPPDWDPSFLTDPDFRFEQINPPDAPDHAITNVYRLFRVRKDDHTPLDEPRMLFEYDFTPFLGQSERPAMIPRVNRDVAATYAAYVQTCKRNGVTPSDFVDMRYVITGDGEVVYGYELVP